SNDRIICPGEETTIFASSSADLTWVGLGDESSYVVSPEETTVYTIEGIDDNDCFVNSSTMVTVLPTPTLEIPSDIEICSGEPIELSASSDGAIQWSGFDAGDSISIAPLESMSYSVTATSEDDCFSTGAVQVNVLEEAYPLFEVSQDQEICLGDTVMLIAFSENSTLIWEADPSSDSLIVQPTEDSFFTITAMNGDQCSITDSVLVAVNEASQVELELFGTSLESTGAYSSYQWFFNDVLIEGEESSTLELDEDGIYTVVAFDAIGCSTAAEYDYTLNTVQEQFSSSKISVFPNPMNNNAQVSFSGTEIPKELYLSDGQGRKIKTLSVTSQQGTWLIERNGLAGGLYFVNVLFEDGHQDCIRVIVH
ncbi:MAG: T9SS type A sorting domain-containing protein, partial [Flavobacteriales bacterium]